MVSWHLLSNFIQTFETFGCEAAQLCAKKSQLCWRPNNLHRECTDSDVNDVAERLDFKFRQRTAIFLSKKTSPQHFSIIGCGHVHSYPALSLFIKWIFCSRLAVLIIYLLVSMSMGCFTHINHHLSQEAGSAPLETMPIDFMATMFGRHFGNNSSFPPFYLSLSFSSSFSFLGFLSSFLTTFFCFQCS